MRLPTPVMKGLIARRILLNYRVDPTAIASVLPSPFKPVTHKGFAVVGVCLIRLEQLRPKQFPAFLGLTCENMAHRIAVQYPTTDGLQKGVFIWRRDTQQRLISTMGGRIFPGAHQLAQFIVQDDGNAIRMDIQTGQHKADVHLDVAPVSNLNTPLFENLSEASHFFRQGDCGFSPTRSQMGFDGLRLSTTRWVMQPLEIHHAQAMFYTELSQRLGVPIELDCALLMRDIPHDWRSIKEVIQ